MTTMSEIWFYPRRTPVAENLFWLNLERALLAHIHRLLSQGWNQGPTAQNAQGRECAPESPQACSWCLMGAGTRAGVELAQLSPYTIPQLLQAEHRLVNRLTHHLNRDVACPMAAVTWNERPGRTQSEVLQLLESVLTDLDFRIGANESRQPLAEPQERPETPERVRREPLTPLRTPSRREPLPHREPEPEPRRERKEERELVPA